MVCYAPAMNTLLNRLLVVGAASLLTGLAFSLSQETKPVDPIAPVEEKAPNPMALIKTSMGDIKLELFADECPKTVANFLGLADGTLAFSDMKTGQKVTRPFYDNINFHRVIPNFMAQGGCPLGTGSGGPGFQFEDEINANALGLDKVLAMQNGQPNRALLIQSQEQFQREVVQVAIKKLGIKTQEEFETRKEELNAALNALTLKEIFVNMGYKYNETRGSHAMSRGTIAMANSGANTNGSQFFLNMVDNDYLNGKHTVFGRIVEGMDVVDAMQKVKMDQGNKPIEPITIKSIRSIVPAEK